MKIALDDMVVVNNAGWYWPKNDGNGNLYTSGSCWYGLSVLAPDVPKQISEFVPKKGVVVQAGGNCGQYIKQYAELFETVYTFEPDPLNFLCLTLNCPFINVFKYQACVGNERTLLDLTVNEYDIGATFVTPDKTTGLIPTLKIDDLNLNRCDLIQLDTEGFEFFGLLGAENTINKFKPVLSIEWYQPWAERYGVTLEMLENYLAKWNYALSGIHVTDRVYISK